MRTLARNWTPLIHAAAFAIGLALAASVAILWAWNAVAHDLLGAPKAQVTHVLVLLGAAATLRMLLHRRHG
ncbi:MAG TPA: hypothetical protein VFB08_08050 [Burkholderiales bacterium]|nr:hypothetical protein [Burkholderiales bacterium]